MSNIVHITFERMSDAVDETVALDAEEQSHLASCADCRSRVDRLSALRAETRALPREVPLPDDSWRVVSAAIDRGRVVALPATGVARAPRYRWLGLAAAGVALVVGTASVTVAFMRARSEKMAAAAPVVAATPDSEATTSIVTVDRSYAPTLTQLTATLAANRHLMSPATAARVDRSLRLIDEAIAEVRDAISADPNNQVLLQILTTNYRQKVDLLRRASELQPSTSLP